MSVKCKRLFSLLLALALIFSLTTTAFAAEMEGSGEPEPTVTEVLETEPEPTPEPEATEPPGDTMEPAEPTEAPTDEGAKPTIPPVEETQAPEVTEPTEATEPTEPEQPEETIPEEPAFTITPDPIIADNPYDPDWPYPYGLTVDNDFPADLLEADPYGIALLADMSLIPDEMYDNAILRALAYTGYDVDYLKDNSYLYVAQYVGSNIKNYAPQVLSGIGYDDYSPFVNGDETVADSSTVSGKAPNMAKFREQGFVCGSFVSYYLLNYLPNMEGIDTSHIFDAVSATTWNNGGYSLASVWAWETGLRNLAAQSGSGVTRYTDSTTAYANLVPGDVVVFSDSSGGLAHVAIYAGAYTMYNASGTNRGTYHYIIHVGNSRGPEISAVEYMTSAGSKSSTPSAFYHLELEDPASATGSIEVFKADPGGWGLSGAVFTAVHAETGDRYTIGPTNSSGFASIADIPLGTYTVTETVFPSGYTASGQTSWTVTLTKDVSLATVYAVNELITGGLKIQKATNTGAGLSGWQFGVYTDASCTQAISGSPFTTNASGVISVAGLAPGTYYVKELSAGNAYWTTDNGVKTVKVTGSNTATVTVTNTHYGYAEIVKRTNTGQNLSGWKFNIYSDQGCTKLFSGSPFTTDASGKISVKLLPGTYYVREVDESAKYPDWQFDTALRSVTVKAGATASVSFENAHYGYAKITKATNTGKDLAGWKFNVFTDQACTTAVPGSPFTTDENGNITARLLPGDYYVQEVDDSQNRPGWTLDISVHKLTVKAGETASITVTNTHNGQAKIIKAMPDGGSAAGWTFEVYRAGDNTLVGTYTTGEDGTILTDYLTPGEYFVKEILPEDSLYWCESTNPQSVTIQGGQVAEVTFTNHLRPGVISVLKVDETGTPRAGADFLLEWSEDGTTWAAVTYSETMTKGGCNSPGLADGKLTSGSDGTLSFEGLHPELYYRVTETAAPDGLQKLTGYAFEGQLPIDRELTVALRVVNAPVFTLPKTGGNAFGYLPAMILLCGGIVTGAWVSMNRKRNF